MNEAGFSVEPDFNIEALIAHLAVDLRTCIKLPKLDAIRVGLKYLVHDIQKRELLRLVEMKVNNGVLEEVMRFFIGTCVPGHSLEVVIDCL
jgi:hypothetical protein